MADIVETKDAEARESRGFYTCSKLPTLKSLDGTPSADDISLLKMLYEQVCTTWRALLDIRFKLLGLIPFVTVAAVVVVSPRASSTDQLRGIQTLLVGVVGLLVTVGLMIYDKRNSELYNDLISRGRRIEAELKLTNGVFLGRPRPAVRLLRHGSATMLVYVGAVIGWLYVIVAGIATIGGPQVDAVP
ncbi:MAG: hypothetical protein JW741_26990 [Sedimentisphaerales bacterium]|nr:hypothetical protein [Sedimentisphaerales bacterium]